MLEGSELRWKLIFADDYTAHKDEAIRRLAWREKCVVVFHGGGTTGVAAVNDTHLHEPLSQRYQELQMQQQFVLMDMDPAACPKRRRQDCVSDLAACWRDSEMHLRALAGWKANMITNALDGSENNLGSSEMQGYWMELGMDEVRARTIHEVCSSAEAGRLE